jgi:mercuric ion transport protein
MEKLIKLKDDFVSIASLFTSFSTLICCALPSLLVAIGMGAVLAGMVSDFPLLVTLSKYKDWTFLVAGLLIGFNFWLFYGRKSNQACEIDENGKETACDTAARWSKVILWISAGTYLAGLFMAYLLLPLQQILGL